MLGNLLGQIDDVLQSSQLEPFECEIQKERPVDFTLDDGDKRKGFFFLIPNE